jgi:hypothetical protein
VRAINASEACCSPFPILNGIAMLTGADPLGLDRQLAQQSTLMVNTASDGLVIDYRSSGYTGFDARDVIHAGGNRKLVGSRSGKPLGQLLANEFLDCKIGVPDLFFDPEKENWNIIRFIGDEQPFHVISTTVKQTPIPDRS